MRFSSEKSGLFGVVILGSAITLVLVSLAGLLGYAKPKPVFALVCSLLIAVFMLWLWFGTYYRIKDGTLFYYSGPIRGSLKIQDINTLIVNKTLWVGMKPALATNGIIVKYNKYDEVYLSPRDKDAFIKELLKFNGNIKIVR